MSETQAAANPADAPLAQAAGCPEILGEGDNIHDTVGRLYERYARHPLPARWSRYRDWPAIFIADPTTASEIATFRGTLDTLQHAAGNQIPHDDAWVVFAPPSDEHSKEWEAHPGLLCRVDSIEDMEWPRWIACNTRHPQIKNICDKLADWFFDGEYSDEVPDSPGDDYIHEEVHKMAAHVWREQFSVKDRVDLLLQHECNPVEALRGELPCDCEGVLEELTQAVWDGG